MKMVNFQEYYDALYDFTVLESAISRKNASKDTKKVEKRTRDIVATYNKLTKIVAPIFAGDDKELKRDYKQKLIDLRDRLIQNLTILDRKDIHVPKDLLMQVNYTTIARIKIGVRTMAMEIIFQIAVIAFITRKTNQPRRRGHQTVKN